MSKAALRDWAMQQDPFSSRTGSSNMDQTGDSSNYRKQYGTTVSIDTVFVGSTLVASEDIWVTCQTFFVWN